MMSLLDLLEMDDVRLDKLDSWNQSAVSASFSLCAIPKLYLLEEERDLVFYN